MRQLSNHGVAGRAAANRIRTKADSMNRGERKRDRTSIVEVEMTSRYIDWYAEGQECTVEACGIRMIVRFVGRKGRRARIMITAPAGSTFVACGSSGTKSASTS